MSLELYDIHDVVGPVASNHGWVEVLDALKDEPDKSVQWFLRKGYTERPAILADRLRKVDARQDDVNQTVKNLAELLDKVRGPIAILSDGVGTDHGPHKGLSEHFSDKRKAAIHLNLDEARKSVNHSHAKLVNLLTGADKAKLISSVAKQTVAQLRRGIPVAELRYTTPPDLAHKILPHVKQLYWEAKRQAREETEKLVKRKPRIVDNTRLYELDGD